MTSRLVRWMDRSPLGVMSFRFSKLIVFPQFLLFEKACIRVLEFHLGLSDFVEEERFRMDIKFCRLIETELENKQVKKR